MPTIQPRPEARAAHAEALRLIGQHNDRIAEVLIVCGAYEVYQLAGTAHAVVERADGPAGWLYVASEVFDSYAQAIRYACEKSIENIRLEIDGPLEALPAPVPGIKYRDGDTEYEVIDGRLMKRLPFAPGWTPAA